MKGEMTMQKKKVLLGILALVLVAAISVGGTLAWMTDTTGVVQNTFTSGKVDIDLKEHELIKDGVGAFTKVDTSKETVSNEGYKLIPGREAQKDPFVKVLTGSEDCFIYIEVVEENNTLEEGKEGKIVQWEAAQGWTLLTGKTGKNDGAVYYYNTKQAAGATVKFLANDKVTINPNFEKLADETKAPVLKFYAYAVQAEGMSDAADAWNKGFGTGA